MSRVGWLDCSSGVSGDMLLGALTSLGALDELPAIVERLDVGARVSTSQVRRGPLAATQVVVEAPQEQPARHLTDVLALIDRAAVPAAVRDRGAAVFRRLADAEGRVHGVPPSEVHFHEVGAVDTIVDVLGACLGLHALGLDRLTVSPIALGGGSVATAHGTLPVPGPAVLALLESTGLTAYGGQVDVELTTPTGAALLAELADSTGDLPAVAIEATGVGAGSRDLPGHPNVVRLVVGQTAADAAVERAVVLEANVDDLDPRLWPGILSRLLEAGAGDAWLTPILMKKGRPAHTLHVLAAEHTLDEVRRTVFRETTTIGLRETAVAKRALPRETVTVEVDGCRVRVKLARLDGHVVNAVPEFEDVVAAALALGRPAKAVLADAVAAAGRS